MPRCPRSAPRLGVATSFYSMAPVSLWRAGARLALVASTLGGGAAAATIATSDDPETALKICTAVPHRLIRDAITAANIAFGTLDLAQPF